MGFGKDAEAEVIGATDEEEECDDEEGSDEGAGGFVGEVFFEFFRGEVGEGDE